MKKEIQYYKIITYKENTPFKYMFVKNEYILKK